MHDQPFVSLIIPAYNEEKRIAKILDAAVVYQKQFPGRLEIIVVNDGSIDRTAEVAAQFKNLFEYFTVLSLPQNKGKGAAVRAGMVRASGDVLVFADADNSTSLDQLDSLLGVIESGAEIAIGSRSISGSRVDHHQPWYKELGGKFGNVLIQWLLLPGIRDTQCGFKAFRDDVAKELFSVSEISGWGFDIEILARARKKGYTIVEVPIVWKNDTSSRVTFWSYFSVLRDVFKIRRTLEKD